MYGLGTLDIKFFKFFSDTEALDFTQNGEVKNILLYGENGSGKSTIFWALYTFLQSSFKEKEDIKNYFSDTSNPKSLVNTFEEDISKSYIKLSLKDSSENNKNFTISKDTIDVYKGLESIITNINLASDFINYKYIFRFFNFSHKNDIDLFELFKYEIFHFKIDEICLKNLLEEIEISDTEYISEGTYDEKVVELQSFNSNLELIISKLEFPTNQYIQSFNITNIKISFSMIEGSYEGIDKRLNEDDNEVYRYKFNKPKINIKIEQKVGSIFKPIFKPQSYFNEAKLTAIALSVRLAVTQIKLKDSPWKILVLDDLLVSLDMSNRDKFLDILLNDENLEDFQKIILTHDRAFFEMAKDKFDYVQRDKWKNFEMYVDRDEIKDIEKPHIKESKPNLERAKEHFKNKDYPASGNYLRKEVEKLFNEFLKLDNLAEKIKLAKLKENEHLIWDIQKDFKKLLTILKQFENCEKMPPEIQMIKCKEFSKQAVTSIQSITKHIEENFHFEEFEDVKMILKNILNPQSHSDFSRPLYKKELEDSILLVEEFDRILNNEN